MRGNDRKDVDCAGCLASERCWQERVPAGAGFMVQRVRPLVAGEVLFRAGTPFQAPFVVTSGCISVTELLESGAERIVAFRVAGEVVGLESSNQRLHRHGAQAVSSATVCRLRWSASGLEGRSAAVLKNLLAKIIAQCEQAGRSWAGLSAVERVREFVDDYHRRTVEPLSMTRAQIGQYLGMAEETVVRAFAELRRRALVDPASTPHKRRNARSHTP